MKLQRENTFIGSIALLFFFCFCLCNLDYAYGQKKGELALHGFIYNSSTKKPVTSGTVFILELKQKAIIDASGSYRITVPVPGIYNLVIQSEGMKVYKGTIILEQNTIKNFPLDVQILKSEGITITGRRDIQSVSRHTMNLQQMKEVPATFGDSMNAIASLPGVIRIGGDLFGPIVIRGGDFRGIKYTIDDIPINSPLHYGGLHSVINSNLIDQIDLYSSAFPAEIGQATSAVISINTIDDVKEFGGYTDLSILAASALAQTCIIKNDDGGTALGSPLEDQKKDQKTVGYIIASGRLSYIDLIVLPLVGLLSGQHINMVPNYWDYQFKAKYFFNRANSLTIFAMGSNDYFRFTNTNKYTNDGSDPLLTGLRVNTDQMSHGQGLYYTYQPSEKFRNRLTFYSSLRDNSISLKFPAPGVNVALSNLHVVSRPYVFGLTDKFKAVAVKKYLEIRGGLEYNLYYFTASGNRPSTISRGFSSDLSRDTIVPTFLKERIFNHLVGGYVETKITYGGLTIMPGFRSDYLKRAGEVTWDPRCLISYEFPTETTISVAGGKYSNFFQINPNFFDASPQYAKIGDSARSEWAIHRVVGLEQVLGLFKIKAEGFWNEFFNLGEQYLHIGSNGNLQQMMSTGKIRAYGAEIMLKRDRKEDENGIFGWISYTYTRSQFKSGLPSYPGINGVLIDSNGNVPATFNDIFLNQIGNPWSNKWLNYSFEQNHSLKAILGYVFGKHTFTGKFMLFSSTPYTPIVFYQEDLNYAATYPGQHRYYPLYGRPQSRHFPINHRLDFRYSNTTSYTWGYVSWYVEIINVYNNRPIVMEKWDYRLPMYPRIKHLGPGNPQKSSYTNSISFIPNFGVEVKF
jgi:hypothetical protein